MISAYFIASFAIGFFTSILYSSFKRLFSYL